MLRLSPWCNQKAERRRKGGSFSHHVIQCSLKPYHVLLRSPWSSPPYHQLTVKAVGKQNVLQTLLLLPLYCFVHWLRDSHFFVTVPSLAQWRFPNQCLWPPLCSTLWGRKQQWCAGDRARTLGIQALGTWGPLESILYSHFIARKLGPEEENDLCLNKFLSPSPQRGKRENKE